MREEKQPSLKVNMVLNSIRGVMSVLFPLITFPYVSRILGVENIGKYNFADSVIGYFSLFAGLGISTYAIREGARIRDNPVAFRQIANEVFTINTLSTVVSYGALLLTVAAVPKFAAYRELLLIFSLQVAFAVLAVEWIYSIYEDYLYITLRSIAFQVLSLVCLFLFVRDSGDVCIYAAVTVVSRVGAYFLNFWHARKYGGVGLTRHISWRRHMKPVLVLFAMSATTTLYVSSDVTILGFLCGDYSVGIYSVSTKVYGVVKGLLSSVLVVSIPRISALLGKGDQKGVEAVASDIYRTLISFLLPAMVGIVVLRREIILILADETYLAAVPSLVLLVAALLFCMGAWFWGQGILVPYQREGIPFKATVASALLNVSLNFLLIPLWQEKAAALTTALSEGLVFFWCAWEGGKLVKLSGIAATAGKACVGCGCIYGVVVLLRQAQLGLVPHTVLSVGLSVIVYLAVEVLLKNEAVAGLVRGGVHALRSRRGKENR